MKVTFALLILSLTVLAAEKTEIDLHGTQPIVPPTIQQYRQKREVDLRRIDEAKKRQEEENAKKAATAPGPREGVENGFWVGKNAFFWGSKKHGITKVKGVVQGGFGKIIDGNGNLTEFFPGDTIFTLPYGVGEFRAGQYVAAGKKGGGAMGILDLKKEEVLKITVWNPEGILLEPHEQQMIHEFNLRRMMQGDLPARISGKLMQGARASALNQAKFDSYAAGSMGVHEYLAGMEGVGSFVQGDATKAAKDAIDYFEKTARGQRKNTIGVGGMTSATNRSYWTLLLGK